MHLALLGAAGAAVLAAVAVALLLRSAPRPEVPADDLEVPRAVGEKEQPSYL
ncbi:hypothetical protein ACWGKW_17335 [Streptomyces sp. NPDC054766]